MKIIKKEIKMNKLKIIASEILEILDERRKELELSFIEDSHTYYMKDIDGVVKDSFPSVSKVIKYFYEEFDSEGISFRKANGDLEVQKQLLKEWKEAGDYATNIGSRVHYLLEKKSLELFDIEKEVRQPLFDCDFIQILKGDSMVASGTKFLETMKERGAWLLDTEMVLGDPELGYVGQPDKMWLIENREKTEVGIICTDYKTNKPKNFESNQWTKNMLSPFQTLPDNALGHYFTQLPFYCKLLLKMLQGSKYENIKVFGGIVVLVKDDGTFEEFRVPPSVLKTILEMDIKKYLD